MRRSNTRQYVQQLNDRQLEEYRARLARALAPIGYNDDRGIWYPDPLLEKASCCDEVSQPTNRKMYAVLYRHCCTAIHIYTRDLEHAQSHQ